MTPIVASSGTLLPIQLSSADAIAVTPDGKTAYVVSVGDRTMTPVSVRSKSAGKPIKVGSQPQAVAITPDGKRAEAAAP